MVPNQSEKSNHAPNLVIKEIFIKEKKFDHKRHVQTSH